MAYSRSEVVLSTDPKRLTKITVTIPAEEVIRTSSAGKRPPSDWHRVFAEDRE